MSVISPSSPIPALALITAGGRVRDRTDAFGARYASDLLPLELCAVVERVLDGEVNLAAIDLAGADGRLEAVTDSRGQRHALLTLAAEPAATWHSSATAFLDVPIDESPAIVYLKDLEGRYLRANRRFQEFLGIERERLSGRTDAELAAAETVDGPRLRGEEPPGQEPLELEYIVPGFERRPPMAVLRFTVRDQDEEPVAVCAVAAPLADAHVARAECARLIKAERWARLDPDTVKAELLSEWGVVAVEPTTVAIAPREDIRPAAHAARPLAPGAELAAERVDQLERTVARLQARVDALERAQSKAPASRAGSQLQLLLRVEGVEYSADQ